MVEEIPRILKTHFPPENGGNADLKYGHLVVVRVSFGNGSAIQGKENSLEPESLFALRILWSYMFGSLNDSRFSSALQCFSELKLNVVLEFIQQCERRILNVEEIPVIVYIFVDEYQCLRRIPAKDNKTVLLHVAQLLAGRSCAGTPTILVAWAGVGSTPLSEVTRLSTEKP